MSKVSLYFMTSWAYLSVRTDNIDIEENKVEEALEKIGRRWKKPAPFNIWWEGDFDCELFGTPIKVGLDLEKIGYEEVKEFEKEYDGEIPEGTMVVAAGGNDTMDNGYAKLYKFNNGEWEKLYDKEGLEKVKGRQVEAELRENYGFWPVVWRRDER